MTDLPIIDFDELVNRVGGDTDFARELLGDFVTTLPKDVQELNTILFTGSAPEGVSKAHAIKGAAANLSAKRVASLAEAIEFACRGTDLESARAHFSGLSSAAQDLIEKVADI